MPSKYDKDAYPEPPQKTPIGERRTDLPNPADIISTVFYYVVDVPVTAFRDTVERIRSRNRPVFYHKRFRRVPYMTECVEGDYPCYYEAEMQWRRDHHVDKEIVKIVQERLGACYVREGSNHLQNCTKEIQLFEEVAESYRSRYEDLGAYGSARICLMKQKERMIAAQAQKSHEK